MQGRIIKQVSNAYTIMIDGKEYICGARGKFRKLNVAPCVGDIVEVDLDNLIIEEIVPRKNELDRPVVSNVDVALIVTSVKKPDLSLSLLDKELTVINARGIEPVICFTKLDLLDNKEKSMVNETIKEYKKIGYKVFDNKHLGKLKRYLKKKIVVLTGQSGAGKSSLLNRIDKHLNLKTSPISDALNRGVHTTRHTELYNISNIYFVDTPGFSALDLKDIDIDALKNSFWEFSKYSCLYKDCNHQLEKGCEIKKALEKGEIIPSRYINYSRFLGEINESSSKFSK